MQFHPIRIGAAHFSYFLTLAHCMIFLDQQCLVVRVGRQEGIVVFEDDQVAIPTQPRTGVDHPSIGCRQNRISRFATNVIALVARLVKTREQRTRRGPDEPDIVLAGCGSRPGVRRGGGGARGADATETGATLGAETGRVTTPPPSCATGAAAATTGGATRNT